MRARDDGDVAAGGGTGPPRADLFDPEMIQQIGRLDWIAQTLAQGTRQGLHRSREKGFSTEFADFKPYTRGDDLRLLDWRVFARTERYYVRTYEAETNIECLLVLDASGSMGWRWESTVSKLDYSVCLAAAITTMLMAQQDKVGLLAHDGQGPLLIPLSSRRAQIKDILAALERVRPGRVDAIASLVDHVQQAKPHRGQIVVFSDLEDDPVGLAQAMPQLASRGDDVLLLHVLDRAEVELPYDDGVSHLVDSETGQRVSVNMKDLKGGHAQRVRDFRDHWRRVCDDSGIRYVPLDTSLGYLEAFSRILREQTSG